MERAAHRYRPAPSALPRAHIMLAPANLQPGTRMADENARTMSEQKAWLMQRGAAHAKEMVSRRRMAEMSVTAGPSEASASAVKSLPPPLAPPPPAAGPSEASASAVKSLPPPLAPPPPAAPSLPEPDRPSTTVDTYVSPGDSVETLALAGGDIPTLAALSGAELATALKDLGFRGLAQRKRLEASLLSWSAAR